MTDDARSVLVTGGNRGIGLAIAQAMSLQGARGCIFDRRNVAVACIAPEGFATSAVDVTSEAEIAARFAELKAIHGRLDIVVANAGIVPPWRMPDAIDLDEWNRVFAVNVTGVAATIKHAVPLMKARGGSIVITASINALRAPERQMAYTASKTALIGLMRTAALDLGQYGIRVNAVAPGAVMTEALRRRIADRASAGGADWEAVEADLKARAPLGEIASEADIANAAVFLASDWSRRITGHVLPVDAGLGIA